MTQILTDTPEISEIKRKAQRADLTDKITRENEVKEWKNYEKIAFRFFSIFLLFLILPIDWKFYQELFSIKWTQLNFHDLFRLAKYQPAFFPLSENGIPVFGLKSFGNWGLGIVLALAGTIIWTRFDQNRKEYNTLYYWLRVTVRFRLAAALVVYGFFKFFPLQMPYPSLSNLLTNYGDFYAWKIYFQTVGIAPNYQSFLGFVEILAAILIFNRRTVTFGVGLVIGFLGNVAVANGFYEIGEHVFSTFLVLLAAVLIVNDIPRLYNMLVRGKFTLAYNEKPVFDPTVKKARLILKSGFIFFIILFGIKTYDSFKNDPYKIPKASGIANTYGFYNVKEFTINNKEIPYSKTDTQRWQDVVFEKWATISIKVNRPVKVDQTNAEIFQEKDIDRTYEVAGYAGRHYFHYEKDTVNHTIALQNKNRNHRDETMFLNYKIENDSVIVLSGINENKDSIRVVLNKINKKFLMQEGRRKEVKL